MIESNWFPAQKHPTVDESAPLFEYAWAARFPCGEGVRRGCNLYRTLRTLKDGNAGYAGKTF